MAATSAGQQQQQQQQQQQHKLNIITNAETFTLLHDNKPQRHPNQHPHQQQQLNLQLQQQQQQAAANHSQKYLHAPLQTTVQHLHNYQQQAQQQQQQQQKQQQQTKFVSRVVTNAATKATLQQSLQQAQTQILPAGLVNGGIATNMLQKSHVFLTPQQQQQRQQQQQQQQQQQTNQHHLQLQIQRPTQIKLPLKAAITTTTSTTTAAAAAATTGLAQCMPSTIASRQMSHQSNLNMKNTVRSSISNSNSNSSNASLAGATIIASSPTTSLAAANHSNPNLAPGWRRLTTNNEVAYISPTGQTLRTQFQIKDYLLTKGTCKCGLPCPLRPDHFFEFNAQVPNMPLESSGASSSNADVVVAQGRTESALSSSSSSSSLLSSSSSYALCMHKQRFLESQQLHAQPNAQTVIESLNAREEAKSKDVEMIIRNINLSDVQKSIGKTYLNASVNVSSQAHKMLQSQANVIENNAMSGAEMKLLTQQHSRQPIANTATATPAAAAAAATTVVHEPLEWQQQQSHNNSQQEDARRLSVAMSKQLPNFKEDPTGYLQQQTTLLHNSMLNVSVRGDDTAVKTKSDEAVTVPIAAGGGASGGGGGGGEALVKQMLEQLRPEPPEKVKQLQIERLATTNVATPSTQQKQRVRRMSLFSHSKWDLEQMQCLEKTPAITLNTIQQQQQQQKKTSIKLVPVAPELSPVSSSSIGFGRTTAEAKTRHCSDVVVMGIKRPEQVGAISTSHESPRHCLSSPADSLESSSSSSTKTTPSPSPVPAAVPRPTTPQISLPVSKPQLMQMRVHAPLSQQQQQHQQQHQQQQQQQQQQQGAQLRALRQQNQTRSPAVASATGNVTRNCVTSIAGPRATTMTLTATTPGVPQTTTHGQQQQQIIMTSTGQLLVIPSNGKPQQVAHQHARQQILVGSSNSGAQATSVAAAPQATSVIIQQQSNSSDLSSNCGGGGGGSIILQNAQSQATNGYIVSQQAAGGRSGSTASASLQPTTVILNSGQNILTANNAKLLAAANSNNILHHQSGGQQILASGQVLTSTNQPTVVLNTLPNGGYIVQQQHQTTHQTHQAHHHHHHHHQQQQQHQQPSPTTQQFATVDASHIMVQQPTQQIILSSPDTKRRVKKRKNSVCGMSPPHSPIKTMSPQISPSIPNQTPTLLQQSTQIATQTATHTHPQIMQIATSATTTPQFQQQFQLSPGIQGIVVNKPAAQAAQQPQQLLLQNGQIIQPVNLIGGQQLLMPTGLVMAPETTLLQIQNVGTCAQTSHILTPQGHMMMRTPSPQNKPFISPTPPSHQQFIVGANGQLSPIGPLYSASMGLVLPSAAQQTATATTFVQASPTIQLQQQQQQHQHQQQQQLQQHTGTTSTGATTLQAVTASASFVSSEPKHFMEENQRRTTAASPPDTTTCSPRSPERPPSHRSTGSDMVQCVSSSEPDGAVSPQSTDSRQSPSSTECERGNFITNIISSPANIYKPPEAKIRRIQMAATGQQGGHLLGQGMVTSATSHATITESPKHSPTTTTTMTTTSSMVMSSPSPVAPTTTATRQQHQQSATPPRKLAQKSKTPKKGNNNRTRLLRGWRATSRNHFVAAVSADTSVADELLPLRSFAIGELIWGPARGHPAWPGKIVKMPDGVCTPSQQFDHVWVQWFGGGGRSTSELIPVNSLQSLTEGLDAHHKAQKHTRKSRKLNSQLERAIQEAMIELDNISACSTQGTTATTSRTTTATTSSSTTTTAAAAVVAVAATNNNSNNHRQLQQPTSTSHASGNNNNNTNNANNNNNNSNNNNNNNRSKRTAPATSMLVVSTNALHSIFNPTQQRAKPIRIAPAPAPATTASPTTTLTSSDYNNTVS